MECRAVAPDLFKSRLVDPLTHYVGLLKPANTVSAPPLSRTPHEPDEKPPNPLPSRHYTSITEIWNACRGVERDAVLRQQACSLFSSTLKSLKAACLSSAKSGHAPTYREDNPCQAYGIALALQQPKPSSSGAPARSAHAPTPKPTRPPAARARTTTQPRVYVNQCTSLRYGSIKYRQCRAREKERLIQQCRRTTNEADYASGAPRQRLRLLAEAQCREADRYEIIR